MNKRLTLWQKLKIKYHYHWMDGGYSPFLRHAALPTWYMTHSQEQIDVRQAEYEAEVKRHHQEWAESVHLLKCLIAEYQKEQGINGDNEPSSIS